MTLIKKVNDVGDDAEDDEQKMHGDDAEDDDEDDGDDAEDDDEDDGDDEVMMMMRISCW